ncbi:MAG: hypothetical protein M1838_006175 [Thelocarpon superellum]|nr:MAG: hypothetical protein M1838_006175 [Thelocarpon superellum]
MAMRRLTGLVALPLSLLLVATPTQSLDEVGIQTQPWPLNLAAHEKYWPHDGAHAEAHRKRQVAVDPASPIAVKKMGTDEGEKFFLDYWQFGTAGATAGNESAPAPQPDAQDMEEPVPAAPATGPLLRPRLDERTVARGGNASATTPYNPPLRIHTELTSVNPHFKRDLSSWSALFAGRARRSGSGGLAKRGFQCPTGSSDCSGIGRPNTCCDQGETCNIIPDTGLGDVGCCPPGQTCSGNLDNCDLGFTKCSDDLGGGCCIPMYVCLSIGCGPGPGLASLLVTTLTATTTKLSNPPSAAPSTTISSSSPPPITTTTTSTATYLSFLSWGRLLSYRSRLRRDRLSAAAVVAAVFILQRAGAAYPRH